MSFTFKGQKMHHAAVNTDPLHQIIQPELERKEIYYGLKERNIPHIKINEMKEINVWYNFGEKIGEGGFGTVISVTEKKTNKPWAMKTVSKSVVNRNLHPDSVISQNHNRKDEKQLKLVQQEIDILKLIRHPHIIYLDKIFETSRKMYMIFEKCHGDFAVVYNERKPFIEEIAKKIISELVDAIAYLHKYDIVHRDLKMENILLGENPKDPTDEYYIKLTDFGLSIVQSGKGVDSMLHDYCGTVQYMAPEMITTRSYSQTCDMWALGVILYMLVVGSYPFYSKNEKELQTLICTTTPVFNDNKLSSEVTDLILQLLVKEPVNRIRATEVLQHPWLKHTTMSKTPHYNILEKMKLWKSEMTVETAAASDWDTPPENDLKTEKSRSKQVMRLPVTTINFNRNKTKKTNTTGYRASVPRDSAGQFQLDKCNPKNVK